MPAIEYDSAVVRAVIRRKLQEHGVEEPLEFDLEPIVRRLCLGYEKRTWDRDAIVQAAREGLESGSRKDEGLRESIERTFHIGVRETATARKDLQWLKEHGADEGNLERFKAWWSKNFRGRDGNPPTLGQIVEFWPSALQEDFSPGGYDGYLDHAANS